MLKILLTQRLFLNDELIIVHDCQIDFENTSQTQSILVETKY